MNKKKFSKSCFKKRFFYIGSKFIKKTKHIYFSTFWIYLVFVVMKISYQESGISRYWYLEIRIPKIKIVFSDTGYRYQNLRYAHPEYKSIIYSASSDINQSILQILDTKSWAIPVSAHPGQELKITL